HDGLGLRRDLIRIAIARPAVGVHADLRAERPADQVVHGLPRRLAHDVPARLLEAADRGVEIHRAALAAEVRVRHVREVLDVEHAAADEIPAERLDVRLDGPVAVCLRVALAPAVESTVGLDADEQPLLVRAGIDEERADALDVHAISFHRAASRSSAAGGSGPRLTEPAAYSRCSMFE